MIVGREVRSLEGRMALRLRRREGCRAVVVGVVGGNVAGLRVRVVLGAALLLHVAPRPVTVRGGFEVGEFLDPC
jgi:hypothetical protein